MKNKDIQKMISEVDKLLMEYRRILKDPRAKGHNRANMLFTFSIKKLPELIRLNKLEKQILQRALSGSIESHRVWKVIFWNKYRDETIDLFIGSSFESSKKYIQKVWRVIRGKLEAPNIVDYDVNIFQGINQYVIEISYTKRKVDGSLVENFLRVGILDYTKLVYDSGYMKIHAWEL